MVLFLLLGNPNYNRTRWSSDWIFFCDNDNDSFLLHNPDVETSINTQYFLFSDP